MSQVERLGPLDGSVGYVLKQAAAALHSAMDAELRPDGFSVAQYSCLEQLRQQPGRSNADLARGAFVSPQAMNEVLRGLERRGLVERPAAAASGRTLPARLTSRGREAADGLSARIRTVEQRLTDPLGPAGVARMLDGLRLMTSAVQGRSADGATA